MPTYGFYKKCPDCLAVRRRTNYKRDECNRHRRQRRKRNAP